MDNQIEKLEAALIAIRDFEPVTNGNYAVDTAIPEMRRIAIAALAANSTTKCICDVHPWCQLHGSQASGGEVKP